MKVSSPSSFEKSPNIIIDIKIFIKKNIFQVTEAYKNIAKLLASDTTNSIPNMQQAYKHIYGNRKANIELLSALEYIHSKIIHEHLSLEQTLTKLGIKEMPNQHPVIKKQRETTHQQIKNTTPNISEQVIEEVNKHNQ